MSNSELGDLLERLDIETYLDQQGITYKRTWGHSGQQLNVKSCPACGNNNWKVYLNAESGLGNCFAGSCPQKTFNKYTFIKHSFPSSGYGGVRAHIESALTAMGWVPKRAEKAVDFGEVELPPHFELPATTGWMPEYLTKRGVTSELAKKFHLGYAPQGSIYSYPGGYQDYSDRVLIPVFDLAGKLSTFQGRDAKGDAEPRYLFPPGLAGSGRFLFNGHNAIGAQRVVVAEGAFDVIGVSKAFEEDPELAAVIPIGTFGMHLSHNDRESGTDQLGAFIALRNQGLREVTFMWDAEREAMSAAAKAAREIARHGLQVRIAFLPQGLDPGDASPIEIRRAYLESKKHNDFSVLRRTLGSH